MSKCNTLKIYSQYLLRNTTPFLCLQCGIEVLCKDYEKHCSEHHGLNSKLTCVWCRGGTSWNIGEKNRNADHLISCWRNFMSLYVYAETTQTSSAVPLTFNATPMCAVRDFFGYIRIPELPRRAYELFWLLPLIPLLLTFTIDSLNLAVACVQMYLSYGDELEWFHVMVKAFAFESFLEAMDRDEGKTRTLPFSCWCDGGKYEQAKHRQHRHMIVVSKKGHFKREVWDHVKTDDRPYSHIPCKRMKRIVGPMHLVNTIGYLSKRKSRCDFSFATESPQENLKHFFIFTSLPAGYRLVLVTQWDGGILQLLDQELKQIDPQKLVQRPMKFSGNRWRILVKDIPGIRLNLALPTRFVPSPLPTPFQLHLANGKKLYFEPEGSTRPHLFYEVIGEEWWTPGPFQQRCLNAVKPIFDDGKQKLEEAERKLKGVERERDSLKRENETMREEIAYLKSENKRIKREACQCSPKINVH